jgi:serine/threonine protein kinase
MTETRRRLIAHLATALGIDNDGSDPAKSLALEAMADAALGAAAAAGHTLDATLTATPRDVPGSTSEVEGRYSMTGGELGRGGLGRVRLAIDRSLDRDVAIKELLRPDDESARVRFVAEARITGQLVHPNIVPVHELARRADGRLYYVMRRLRGQTLARSLRDAPDLPARLALLPHFIAVCQAIAYAHSRGVIHRDLKPDNVMIDDFGVTTVLDWGLGKAGRAPVAHPARAGIQAAQAIHERFTREIVPKVDDPSRLRVCVHAGPVWFGRVGSRRSIQLTVFGETVNETIALNSVQRRGVIASRRAFADAVASGLQTSAGFRETAYRRPDGTESTAVVLTAA